MFVSRLALCCAMVVGGAATVVFSYQRTTARSGGGAVLREWAYQGSVQGLAFAATVYF